jgi:uncharacterized membrane protein
MTVATTAWWWPWLVGSALNSLLLGLAWGLPKKLLTPAGYLHAWVLGALVWGCLGWRGYARCDGVLSGRVRGDPHRHGP